MDFVYNDAPYPHIIINNVLPDNIYKEQMDAFNKFNGSKFTNYKHRFAEEITEETFFNFINNDFKKQIISMCNEMLKIRNERAKTASEIVYINHDKLKWGEVMRCEDRMGYKIKIHPDIFKKIITVIIYMNGKGSGTTLWDLVQGKSYDIIPKPNTALVFVPMQDLSYHSVHKNDVNDRHTIQMTLRH